MSGPVRAVRVQSATRLKVQHEVVYACSCEGFRYVGYCWHLEAGAVKLRALRRASRRWSDALDGRA